ncbi:hypothetical protein AB0269_06815 [Microbacterium sp. NPDC077644]|uniref:hypothetical protein n=1 Tax=Microbacterium sp. NPDC077644 TaxID=3155055 RepID=UPI00344C2E81
MRRSRRFVGIATVALLLAGCSAPLPQSGPIAVYPRPNAGMDALLTGALHVADGCVAVESEDGAVSIPMFPAGDAEWKDEALVWRGDVYREGDTISLGGGYGGADDGYVPEACEDAEMFLVSPF